METEANLTNSTPVYGYDTEYVEQIAKFAHMINRAYCQAMGDHSQPEWEAAPDWQKESARRGVEAHLDDPEMTPEESHRSWFAQKVSDGWTYGAIKDPHAKTHPCMVPYADLPVEQKAKDYLFKACVDLLRRS